MSGLERVENICHLAADGYDWVLDRIGRLFGIDNNLPGLVDSRYHKGPFDTTIKWDRLPNPAGKSNLEDDSTDNPQSP